MQVCSEHTAEGTIWPVDAALRPEGKAGPLVRTLASHRGYYERWAKTWEFQALLKARPVAGDLDLGREYVERHRAAGLAGRRARRVRRGRPGDAPPGARPHPGAARPSGSSSSAPAGCATSSSPYSCCSWCTAAPTSVCGRRPRSSALAELTEGGYVGREDGEALHDAYAFLRTLEHRIQLHQLRRTHVVPEDDAALRRLGRSLGYVKDPVRGARQGSGSTTAARSAGCTRSSSTGRCSPRWPGSRATRPGSRPRRRGRGWRRSATTTPAPPCATSRR